MSVQGKVFSLLLLLGLLSIGLTISIFDRTVDATLTEQVERVATNEAGALARKVVPGIVGRDENAILHALQTSQKITRADRLAVVDGVGLVLSHTDVTETGHRLMEPEVARLIAAGQVSVERVELPEPMLLVGAPVYTPTEEPTGEEIMLAGPRANDSGDRMATVLLWIPLNATIGTRARMIRQLIGIAGGIGAVGIGLAVWILRGILRPVRRLNRATAQIASGQYGVQVPVTGRDELAVLSENFNRMSRVLSQTSISREFLSGILSNMTEPLMVIGAEGKVTMANVAATRLLGYREDEMIGRSAAELLPVEKTGVPGDDTCLLPVESVDLSLVARDGTRIPVVYSCSPMRNADGETNGFVVTARDMTERQRLETAVRRSEKMSAVGQLAAGVAHEINNPLGVILGYSQALVRRLSPGDPLETPLRSIEKEAVRCRNLVQDLLTFSRVSRFEKEPVEINKAVAAALSLVSAQARIGRVAVERHLDDGLPRILGNANQIQQVVINLATNALDAIGQEGTLDIRTELQQDGALSWVCLKVIDSGAGIPPDIAQRIFEPFFTTKPVGKGTGLGLSLIHEIMKKHSGTIDVTSVPGRTEFCARFPVQQPGEAEAA